MDTDCFSEMAWDIVVRAARISDTLKAELGVLSSSYRSEDAWLQGARKFLQRIVAAPDDYVEFWNLDEFEAILPEKLGAFAVELCCQVDLVLATPLSKRGRRMG